MAWKVIAACLLLTASLAGCSNASDGDGGAGLPEGQLPDGSIGEGGELDIEHGCGINENARATSGGGSFRNSNLGCQSAEPAGESIDLELDDCNGHSMTLHAGGQFVGSVAYTLTGDGSSLASGTIHAGEGGAALEGPWSSYTTYVMDARFSGDFDASQGGDDPGFAIDMGCHSFAA